VEIKLFINFLIIFLLMFSIGYKENKFFNNFFMEKPYFYQNKKKSNSIFLI